MGEFKIFLFDTLLTLFPLLYPALRTPLLRTKCSLVSDKPFHLIPDLLRGIEQMLIIEMGVSRG